ncbi:hypothetical protein Tco_1290971, partial [Tanacetum coccineum]
EDSSKQGRKIDEIDQDPDITFLQHDVEIQGRHGPEMKFETEVYTAEDVSIAGATITTAGASISTAKTLVYIRRSASKDKEVPELVAGSSKRDAEEELDQGSSKRQKTGENSELVEESKEKEDEVS